MPAIAPVSFAPEAARDTEPPQSKGLNVHFDKLDHLRFLAAFLILFHHAVPAILCSANGVPCEYANSARLTENLHGIDLFTRSIVFEGHSAVALFITLSGFLFARICGTDAIDYGKFILNRVLRIYPMYFGALALAMYLSPANNGLINLLTSVLCLQNISSPITHELITPPLWTVAVEFQFYLLFPFLLAVFSKKGYKPIAGLFAVSLLLKLLVFIDTGSVRDFAYQTLFGRIDQFIVGMLAGWYYASLAPKFKSPLKLLTSVSVVFAGLFLFHLKGGFWHTSHSFIWIFWPGLEALAWGAVIVSYCSSVWSLPSRFSKALCSLGSVSFSMYICHYALAHLIAKKAGAILSRASQDSHNWLNPIAGYFHTQPWSSSLIFVAALVLPVTLLFSKLTYNTIEKPFMDMKVNYKKRRQSAACGAGD